MNPIIEDYPYQRWSDSAIRPGVVGSVGDVNLTPKLKTSCIELPRRVEPQFAGGNEMHAGSNVQDGDEPNFNYAFGARTIDTNWDMRRRPGRIQNGFIKQDVQAPDILTEPFVSQLGDFSWRNKVARVMYRDKTGFDISTGEYAGYGMPRGGLIPRIVDWAEDDNLNLKNNFNTADLMKDVKE